MIRAAFDDSRVTADQIGYVEAHGTGTILGDPIEIAGLTQAFQIDTQKRQCCAIGSAKSNLGHLEPAAGILGLIKVLLSMREAVIPPTLHVEEPNPGIDFADTPFYLPDGPIPWPKSNAPRLAGISSFGFGGTNAHVVLEEAPLSLSAAPIPGRSDNLLVLSADHLETLQTLAQRQEDYLRQGFPDDWSTSVSPPRPEGTIDAID
ncbi:MAG: polyketide synthase [Planctomycetota bacterium]